MPRNFPNIPLCFFQHNEIFLTLKCFESCMYASTRATILREIKLEWSRDFPNLPLSPLNILKYFLMMKISRNLHIHIYLRTFVLGAKYNEKSFEKGPETFWSLLYVNSNTIKSIDDENIFKVICMGISPRRILILCLS